MAVTPAKDEAAYLYERCRLILDALTTAEPESVAVPMLREVLEKAFNDLNVRGLRMIRRDLIEASQVLDPEALAQLKAELAVQERNDPIHRHSS
jgi:hypothetical protein